MTDTPASFAPLARTGVSPWWRAAAITLAVLLATLIAGAASMFEQFKAQIAHQQHQLAQQPQIRTLAVLLDTTQSPALLVTHDPASGALQLQRLNGVKEGREDSMQLWALRQGQAPLSLGVLTSKAGTLTLPAQADALQGVAQLAISVEDKGGVPGERGPRLPYLFQGAVVHKAI
ncbi:anti-sigma factor domain-containing protein [Rhodoferax sp.]|uniref:anti-sigma factor domain-containing protein n=1 Tax=Rhodoferax sp. TaxID=50421 RepID=UPI003A1039BF